MITYVSGDILESDCEAIVNPVNCVGVMGAGLAKQIKDLYPEVYYEYAWQCGANYLSPGSVFSCKTNGGKHQYVLNVSTKKHWKDPSKMQWVKSGLISLKDFVNNRGVKSVAIPALGCGLGGLDWNEVKVLIQDIMATCNADVLVYEPR